MKNINRKLYSSTIEGTLTTEQYNKEILRSLKNVKNCNHKVGFEFEFYIKKKELKKFHKKIESILPETTQLLVQINQDLNSNNVTWVLTRDSSIKQKRDYLSLELISPILDFKLGYYYLKKILKILQKYKTTKETGLHIHISSRKEINVDPIQIIHNTKKMSKWAPRRYTRSFYELLSYCKKDQYILFDKTIRKCYQVNFNLFDKYANIEYRAIGGKNYQFKIDKIIQDYNLLSDIYSKEYEMVFGSKKINKTKNNLIEFKKNLKYDQIII